MAFGSSLTSQLNTFLGEVSATKGVSGSLARAVTRDRRTGDQRELGPDAAAFSHAGGAATPDGRDSGAIGDGGAPAEADLVVVAGGNLALVYFNAMPERLTLEQIEELHPELVEALAYHPGIGVLMVRSEAHGAVAVGRDGIHYLDEDRIEGADPLEHYGEHAVEALRRLDTVAHTGDIAVISIYEPETGEIAAFEELIGAHGGLGGAQTRPFLLHPSDWEADLAPLVGAPAVYRQLRRWMEDELGFTFGPRPSGS